MGTATLTRPQSLPIAAAPRQVAAAPVAACPSGVTGRVAARGVPARPVAARPVAARPVAARRRPASRLRLTRRGRLLLLLLCAGLLLLAVSVGRAGSQAATATGTGPALQQTTVQPGETLWTVARRIAPQNDTRAVVEQIRRINHLPSSTLRAGQQLLLPVR